MKNILHRVWAGSAIAAMMFGLVGVIPARASGASCSTSFDAPHFWPGGKLNVSLGGSFSADTPPSFPPPAGSVQVSVTMSIVNPAILSGGGSASDINSSGGFGDSAFNTFTLTGVSAGTTDVKVTVSGSSPWDSCSQTDIYTVTVDSGAGTNLPAVFSKTGVTYHNASVWRYINQGGPTNEVACGMQAGGLDNKGTTKLTSVIGCPMTPEAQAAGLFMGGGPIDKDGDFNSVINCDTPGEREALIGVHTGGSSSQLDHAGCGDAMGVAFGPATLISPGPAGDTYCPLDSIIVAVQDAPSKNDSWNRYYCAPVLFPPSKIGPPPGGGKVNVTSQNSVNAATVNSSWNFAGSVADPCGGSPTLCSGTIRNYTGQPAGSAADIYILNTPVNPTGYALHSIKNTIAQVPSENPVLAFFTKDLFRKAQASVICGFLNAAASSCPAFANSFALNNASDVANFIILWDPQATLTVASPVALDLTTPSKAVSVSNTGASGSKLTWSASAPSYSGPGGGWLTVSPSSGSNVNDGTSDSATFTASPVGLTAGNTYTATVSFSGISQPGGSPVAPRTVTVNFTVGAGGPGGPPGTPVDIVSVTPSPIEPVDQPITAKCTGGSNSYVWSATGPAIFSGNTSSTFIFSYSFSANPSVYTITCADANDPTNTASVPVTITQITPACSFTANPNQIVLPGSSSLSWSCTNADGGCNINGTSVNPVSGTLSVSPTANTTYTLTCAGPGTGPNSTNSFPATVRVVGPGVIEYNP